MQYLITAPLGVGGPVVVLVAFEFVVLAVAGVLGFWMMRGVESMGVVRDAPHSRMPRVVGPALCGLWTFIAYLFITSGYPPPIVYVVTGVGLVYGLLVTVTMWATSSGL